MSYNRKQKKLFCFMHDSENILSATKKPLIFRIIYETKYRNKISVTLTFLMEFIGNCKKC